MAKKKINYSPNARIAHKTMAAIDEAIEADGGKLYRYWLQKVLPHIGDAYRQDEDKFRSHLGASGLGHECFRKIYYDYRWFTDKKWPARMLRLFNRGHLEEGRMIAALLMIGVNVMQQDADGKQFRISFAGGHAGGSGDGVASNIPDLATDQWALLEFKTYNDDQFAKLKGDGVKEAKPEHFVQMNTYMRKMGLPIALYGACNKNDDELYFEIVTLNPYYADEKISMGEQIVYAQTPPMKLSQTPGFWKCRFCDHRDVCHLGKAPARNCRTCQHSLPLQDGTWYCNVLARTLSKQDQLDACPQYEVMLAAP